jgi:hypothetical protein
MEKHEIDAYRSLAKQALLQANVRIKHKGCEIIAQEKLEFSFRGPLNEIAWPLITKFPHIEWHANVDRIAPSKPSIDREYRVTDFFAIKDGKKIGEIHSYTRRGYWIFKLYSYDIAQGRKRSEGLATTKHSVVLSTVKHKFKSKPIYKVFDEAKNQVQDILLAKSLDKKRSQENAKKEIVDSIFMYLENSLQGLDVLAPYLSPTSIDKYKNATIAMRSIEDLRQMVETENKCTTLILLDKGGYIVRSKDQVVIYNDETLPTEVRKPLGLLKLVPENGHFVPDVGVRVNECTFLVLTNQT